MADWLDRHAVDPHDLALVLVAGDGRVRWAHNADAPRRLASLMKMVTTLAALELLGPAFRFHTDLLAVPADRRHWRLALRGGGDPQLSYDDLLHMVAEAQRQGMHALLGEVKVDNSRFARLPAPTSGVAEAPGRAFAQVPQALQVAYSALELGLPAVAGGPVRVDPPLPLRVMTRTVMLPPGEACPADWPDGLELKVLPDRVGHPNDTLVLQGPWPRNCPEGGLLRAPLPPLRHLQAVLNQVWRSLAGSPGVTPLRLSEGEVPSYAPILVRHPSRPLAELVRDTNKYSNNLMARTLFLDLAAEQGALPADSSAAAAAVAQWLGSRAMRFDELQIENGSGLSHREMLTAAHLATLMKYALTSPVMPEFLASLSIPGADGSFQGRLSGQPGTARLRLKSGTLEGVHNLAAYRLRPDGPPEILVALLENVPPALARSLQDWLLTWWLQDESATLSVP